MELEAYCALCGVPFDVYADLYRQCDITPENVAWTKYFIALRKARDAADPSNESWFLSGIGQNDGSEGFEGILPSSSYDARLAAQPSDASSSSAVGQAYTNRGTEDEVIYPMHATCWQIFLQSHASLAQHNPSSPDLKRLGHIFAQSDLEDEGRGLVPDWAGDYGGPEQFWDDGWTWNDDIDTSVVACMLEEKPEWNFLVSDPDAPCHLNQLVQHVPLKSSITRSSISPQFSISAHDVFSRLPEELLLEMICFLPTPSVQNARLASKVIAAVQLGTNFWRSRFVYPNELCHIRLPADFPQQYQINISAVDWRELYYRLLHLEDSRRSEGWNNRKRIMSLNSKLIQVMLSEDSRPGEIDPANDLACRHLFLCPGQSIANTTSGIIPTSKELTISTTFRQGRNRQFLSGIAFTSPKSRLELGFHVDLNAKSTDIGDSENLMGFMVALTAEGIVGINPVGTKNESIREQEFGELEENVGKGFLLPADGTAVRGLKVSLAKNRRIVAIGILEKTKTTTKLNRISLPQSLWHPVLPPIDSLPTPAMGRALTGDAFSYRYLTSFGDKVGAAKNLVQINAYMDTDSQIHGFKCLFNHGEATPTEWIPGKAVPCLIDGPGGERINGMEVEWSDINNIAGLNVRLTASHPVWETKATQVLTTRRHIDLASANVRGSDLQIEQYHIKSNENVIGIFGETEVKDGRHGPYQNFGLLCTSNRPRSSMKGSRMTASDDNRRFDDHMNVEESHFPAAPNFRIGEPIGTQPDHGYTCFLDLKKEIKSMTVCLGSRSPGFMGSTNELVGIKVDYGQNSPVPVLLGRCSTYGTTIELPESDHVVKVDIGLIQESGTTEPQTVNQIIFTTQQGTVKGFQGNINIESSILCDHQISLESSACLELIGLSWSFDLRQSLATDHGIQPLYAMNQKLDDSHTKSADIQMILYPSHHWLHSLPYSIRPRPIPAKEGTYYPITPILIPSHSSIGTIRVFFNSFFQGLSFTLSNDETHSIGNLLGAYQDFSVEQNESICSISFYQRHQTTIRTQLPGDILSVEGIRFSVCRWVGGTAHIRHSSYMGPSKKFGPFMNEQRGLWNANWGGSAAWAGCFPLKMTRIILQPGTSFAGMFLESSDTHVRRAGALVSDQQGLPEDVEHLFSRQLKEPPDSAAEDSPLHQNNNSIPYLGTPPPSSSTGLPASGRVESTYRIWCPAPSSLCKIITYRHYTMGAPVVIGLEFISRDGDSMNTLLGHRTMWMEYAIETQIEEGHQVKQFEIEGQHEARRGFEGIKIITVKEDHKTDLGGSDRMRKTVGFYAYVGELLEGVGILEDDA